MSPELRTGGVLVAGAFGQRNPGDDALLAAFAAALPDHRLVVPTGGPRQVTPLPNVTTMSSAGVAVADALRRVDAVVLAGGSVFKVLDPSSGRAPLGLLRRANALVSVAALAGRPTAALGVGAGRLDRPAARRLARRLAVRLDLLVLRDEGSADVLAAAGVPSPIRVGADPVWALLGTGSHAHQERRAQLPVCAALPVDGGAGGPVFVALSHLAGVTPATLAAALASVVERGHHVVLEPWQRDDAGLDDALAHAVAALLPAGAPVTIDPPLDVTDAVARYRGAAAVVGLRFHALVAAAAAGTRFLAVDHEPKLGGLATRLGQRAVPAHAPPGVLRRSLLLALDGPPPDADATRTEVQRALAGFELLRLLLSGGTGMDTTALDGLDLVGGGRAW